MGLLEYIIFLNYNMLMCHSSYGMNDEYEYLTKMIYWSNNTI